MDRYGQMFVHEYSSGFAPERLKFAQRPKLSQGLDRIAARHRRSPAIAALSRVPLLTTSTDYIFEATAWAKRMASFFRSMSPGASSGGGPYDGESMTST